MNNHPKKTTGDLLVGFLLSCLLVAPAIALEVVTFEELSFPPGQNYYNGSDGAGTFISVGVRFDNQFNDFGGDCCWEGFAYSNATDTTTPGHTNQYSAFPGIGADASANYGIAFSGADSGREGEAPTAWLPEGGQPVSVQITNTTYAALSMQQGDSFAKPFGGINGVDPDFFRLVVKAMDIEGNVVDQLEPFYLADYRFADNSMDYILDEWVELDLRPLRNAQTAALEFRLETSDVGDFGPNTPVYVAIDNLSFDLVKPGDFNGDSVVDSADYTTWRDSLSQSVLAGTFADGDFNGIIDAGDYTVWKQYFGSDYTLAALAATKVPEPTTLGLLLVVATALFFRREAF